MPFNAFEFFFYELAKNNLYPNVSKKDLNYGQKFLCGGLAGWGAQFLMNPVGVIKTVYTVDQRKSTGTKNSLLFEKTMEIYRVSGLKGYYRGLSVSMVGIFPYIALKQSTFDFLKNNIGLQYFPQYADPDHQAASGSSKRNAMVFNAVCGASSGFTAVTLVYPFDVIRKRLQLNGLQPEHQYSGISDLIIKLYRQKGLTGFYMGYVATCLKVVPATTILFTCNEYFKRVMGLM